MVQNNILNYNILQQVKNGTKVLLLAGASSSGKSVLSKNIKEMLEINGYNCAVVSTDAFYKNVSEIIMEQYLENNYMFFDKKDLNIIYETVNFHTINKPFIEKFNNENCKRILIDLSIKLSPIIAKKVVEIYKNGINNINFDRPNAVNLKECARYCNTFFSQNINSMIVPERNFIFSRNDYNMKNSVKVNNNTVLIVEGIFALNKDIVNNIKTKNYKIFVDTDLNTMLIRRLNRDILQGRSSMTKDIVIENFLTGTMPGYFKYIYPSRKNATFIFDNSYSKNERNLCNESKQLKFVIKNIDLSNCTKLNTIVQKDYYLNPTLINNTSEVLRIREENGKVKEITHKSEKDNENSLLNRKEQTFNLQDVKNPKLRNSLSINSLFVKAGYTFAGSIKKLRTNYKYNNVEFCVDTFTNGEQILEIQNGTKENIKKLIKDLNLNIINPKSYYSSNFVHKGIEKEIKLKLKNLPKNCKNASKIEQTYLSIAAKQELQNYFNFSLQPFSEVRIRKQNDKCYLTLKSKDLNNRQEKEFIISHKLAEQLLKYKKSKTITKNRYLLAETDNYKIEVDNFTNLQFPLIVAEVEYVNGTEKTAKIFFNKYVDRSIIEKEVTKDVAYKNSHLSEMVKEIEHEKN